MMGLLVLRATSVMTGNDEDNGNDNGSNRGNNGCGCDFSSDGEIVLAAAAVMTMVVATATVVVTKRCQQGNMAAGADHGQGSCLCPHHSMGPTMLILAGNVGCRHVGQRVKMTDIFYVGKHVGNLSADMSAT